MYCSKCGSEIKEENSFCTKCGKKVDIEKNKGNKKSHFGILILFIKCKIIF